jgi:hypothetical protein
MLQVQRQRLGRRLGETGGAGAGGYLWLGAARCPEWVNGGGRALR